MEKANGNEREDKTMASEEKEKKRPFLGERVTDNLADWAGKLKALGEVWGTLSWHEAQGHGSSDALEMCGETLGSIIMDYAEMIETTVNENIGSFIDLDKNVVFPLARCQEVYEWSSKHRHDPDICHIDCQLKQLTDFIHNAATPAIGLKNDFEDLKKEIMAQQKKAPAAVAAAAAA